jgi:ferrous iron transport protein A
MTLNQLNIGQKATVQHVEISSSLYDKLLKFGLTQDAVVECVGKSPFGDPAAFVLRGTVIALRNDDSRHIFIKPFPTP